MPSVLHESLVDMFRDRPRLGAELLALAWQKPDLATAPVETLSIDLSRTTPTEARADAVLRLRSHEDLVLIVEVQLRPDRRKRRVWPLYVASAHHRHRVPVGLLVLTLTQRTAEWAASPIAFGPGATLTPLVIGPAQIPIITRADEAHGAPELAVLSAMAHGRGPDALAVGLAAAEAAHRLDDAATRVYLDLVCAHLNPIARHALEVVMVKHWEPQSDFFKRLISESAAKGREEGRSLGFEDGIQRGVEKGIEKGIEKGHMQGVEMGIAQGRALGQLDGQREVLLRLLDRRFGPLSADTRARVASGGPAELARWTDQILFATNLDEALAG